LKKSNAEVGDSNMQFKNRTVEAFERNIPVETGKTDDSIRNHPYGGAYVIRHDNLNRECASPVLPRSASTFVLSCFRAFVPSRFRAFVPSRLRAIMEVRRIVFHSTLKKTNTMKMKKN
jgi:hypothetical protein